MENTVKYDQKTEWFDDLITQLRVDEVSLQSGTASEEKSKFYKSAMSGNVDEMMSMTRDTMEFYYISKLLSAYTKLLKEVTQKPQCLAAKLFNNKVLIWAQVEDDNELLETELLRAEAKVNAEFHEKGYRISTTVVEESDKVSVPSHYKNMLS